MNIVGSYKAGRLANGAERGQGRIIHGLLNGSWKALCGTEPGRRSGGWLPFDEPLPAGSINCQKCLKKMDKLNVIDCCRKVK